MLIYPHIDPVALALGPLKVRWYGLMYAISFLSAWGLGIWRSRQPASGWTKEQIGDLIFYAAMGVILGGRIGYMLFYNFSNFIAQPWILFKIWEGGMAFHGGLLGVTIALWLYARKFNKPFFVVTDFLAPFVPIGLAAGRIGNFINGELWGRVTNVSWAMIYPHVDNLPRHPSQIYEFLVEGITLFLVLWFYSAKPKPRMAVSALFLIMYGLFRFILEFFRQPDIQLGYIAFDWMTMGQLLSIPMILSGIVLIVLAYRKNR